MSRISLTLQKTKSEHRAALVSFVVAGDPDPVTSAAILAQLPAAGVDIIELGMPFTDPMADGPTIQAADLRALGAGMTLKKTLQMVAGFRTKNTTTPVVLMGYYNPVYIYGPEKFALDAAAAGVDGVILVDLPPEEDYEMRGPLKAAGLDLIRLLTPTSTGERLKELVRDASGFLYYVSIAGVTGTTSVPVEDVKRKIAEIRTVTDLPVAVGFGIRTPEDAAAVGRVADGVVVGSTFVQLIEKSNKNDVVGVLSDTVSAYKRALA